MSGPFRSGQTVRLCRSLQRSGAPSEFKIIRVLPESNGEREYRIKSVSEPYERVVKESDLERA
jgi:hypothetical protein